MDASIYRPRRRRGFWRAHLHRADRREGRASPATCWRSASSTWCRAQAAIPTCAGPDFRQQRRGVVGLSLRRIPHRAEAARSRHDLRDLRTARSRTREALYSYRWQPQTDPFGVLHADLRLSRHSGRGRYGQATARRARRHPDSAAAAFRRDRRGAARGRPGRIRCRRPISAAISTIGGSARAPRSICRCRCPKRCCRSAIPMPRRATAN